MDRWIDRQIDRQRCYEILKNNACFGANYMFHFQIEGGMSDMQRMFLLLNLAEITKTSGKNPYPKSKNVF